MFSFYFSKKEQTTRLLQQTTGNISSFRANEAKACGKNFICFTEPVFRKQNWTIAQILFGMLRSDKKSLALNWLDLIMKYYKWKNTALSFKAFEENVKYEQKLEKEG